MKKLFTFFSVFILLMSTGNFNKANSQTGYNAVVEYCTGTWCQWCPCSHEIIEGINLNYPNTVVLAYHGAGSDPWQSYSSGIRGLFGFASYPTGVVGRQTGITSNTAWNNHVVLQSLLQQPGVSISITSKNYDAATRTLSANISITALTDLTGDYYINYILTENNLVYAQTGNGTCPGNGAYIHNNAVKSMINGDLGELVHSGNWTSGQVINKTLNYVIPDNPQVLNPNNCNLNMFVYKQGTDIRTNYIIQQSLKTPLVGTSGISSNNSVAESYSLSQNYPNPFNPSTTFKFSIPNSESVSLKVYDILGNEVETYIDGFLNAGTYGVEFDGSKLSSGIYFYTLKTDNFTETKKMNLIK
ncbi:MAG TPA: Omp28-related outer membrane protein [Ignavibacteria bacterium]|nr:Omp28-related outer membrane protein [Ignavibacteria bacterium]